MSFITRLKESFTPNEWRWLLILASIALASSGYLLWQMLFKTTVAYPDFGGQVREGIVGQPRFLNPILGFTSDVDRAITAVTYSGLMKFDPNGQLVPDLAEDFTSNDFGRTFDFFLRKNALWHDGQPVTADDVIFTIERIQDPAYKSPLRVNWQGVVASKLDDHTVRLTLRSAYAPFLANATVGILPKHIWEKTDAQSFFTNPANLAPVGTGPFRFETLQKDRSQNVTKITLKAFSQYYLKPPFLETLEFHFFPNQESLISALKRGSIDGAGFLLASQDLTKLTNGSGNLVVMRPKLARYFALFPNPEKQPLFQDRQFRILLSQVIDRSALIDKVLDGEGQPVFSPLPLHLTDGPSSNSFSSPEIDSDQYILEKGWQDTNGDGILEQDGQPLQITITTSALPQLQQTAELVAKTWTALGIETKVETISTQTIIDSVIRPREYQILLFGQVLGQEPDPFSFWHSSQIRDPGLNLAQYQNKTVDELLEKIRSGLNLDEREAALGEFERLISEDQAAIFLYNPHYLYIHQPAVKGVVANILNLPSDRFSAVENWYTKIKRLPRPR